MNASSGTERARRRSARIGSAAARLALLGAALLAAASCAEDTPSGPAVPRVKVFAWVNVDGGGGAGTRPAELFVVPSRDSLFVADAVVTVGAETLAVRAGARPHYGRDDLALEPGDLVTVRVTTPEETQERSARLPGWFAVIEPAANGLHFDSADIQVRWDRPADADSIDVTLDASYRRSVRGNTSVLTIPAAQTFPRIQGPNRLTVSARNGFGDWPLCDPGACPGRDGLWLTTEVVVPIRVTPDLGPAPVAARRP